MTQPLNIKVDSGQARADLDALAKSLDAAGAAAGRMSTGLSSGMGKADAAIKGSMGNMEKFAQVAATLNKIKVDSSGTKAISEFAKVLGQVAKTAEIDRAKMSSWSKFIEMGALSSRLKMDAGSAASLTAFTRAMDAAARTKGIDAAKMASWVKFIEIGARASQLRMGATGLVGFTMFAQAMDNVSKSRAISAGKLKSWVDFIEVAARTQRLKFDPAMAANLTAMGNAIASLKGPSKSAITNLEKMFQVLGNLRRIPGARDIANDLDMVAQAATRASAALSHLPARLRMGGGAGGGGGGLAGMGRQLREAASGADAANGSMTRFSGGADKAGKSSFTLGERLRGLNHRFSLAHQAGSLFNAAFASFTVGGMIKGIFDATIGLAKLEKAMLFTTKSYEGSKRATSEFIGTVYDMGLALDQVAEPFGRFTISASAAGLSSQDSANIFRSVTQTLQVVGASAEQTGYAMYGLTQMIQKGKVSSEEFSRQIGEQIPGNAEAGRRALEKMTGQAVTMQQFFKQMSLGKIASPEFTKLWAEELDTMFKGLMGMVKDRPDVALNRLKTSWTVFQQEVGKGGFMAEAGIQFNRLAEMIGKTENGVFKLNPRFQELAKMLGQNLARMVRGVGDAMVWLADNIEKVLFVAKALATLYVAKTFLSWGKAAMTAVSGIGEMTKALLGLKAAQDAVDAGGTPIPGRNTAKTAKAARSVADAEALGASTVATSGTGLFGRRRRGIQPQGGSMADIINMRAANGYGRAAAPQAVRTFGMRAAQTSAMGPGLAGTVGNAAAFGMRGRGMPMTMGARIGAGAATVGAGAARAGGAVAGALPAVGMMAGRAAMLALGGFGVALAATATALVLLSDKTTQLGGAQVKFGDILKGAISTVTTRVGAFFNDLFNKIFKSSTGFQDFLDKLGPALQTTVDYLILFGEVIADTITGFVQMGVAIFKLLTGDFGGAKAQMEALKENWKDNNPFSAQNMADRGAEGRLATIEAANKRMTEELGNTAAEQRVRDAARLLAEQQAADDQLKAANLQIQAARDMSEAMELPSVSQVMTRLTALADGSYAAANPSMTAEQRTAANVAAAAASRPAAAATAAEDAAAPLVTPGNRYTYTIGQNRPGAGQVVTAASVEALSQAVFAAVQRAPRGGDMSERSRIAGQEARLAVASGRNGDIVRATNNAQARDSFGGVNVPTQYRSRMQSAANANGISPEVMARLIHAESGWRSGVAGTGGDAVGLGQFTQGTWNTVMQGRAPAVTSRNMGANDPRRNADLNMEATARYMAQNQRALQGVLGRDANAGEQYLAHFLGTGGASNMLRKYATDPSMTARAAGVGNQDQYNKNPVFQNGNVTMADLYRWAQGKVGQGGQTGDMTNVSAAGAAGTGGGPSASQIAADEIEKDRAAKSNDWKSLQSILALPDPASQSVSRANAITEQLNDLAIKDEERVKEYGQGARLVTNEVLQQIAAAYQRVFKEMEEAMNPLAKQNRQLKDANDLTLMTAAGLGRQAQWQEKINDLREQGYDIDLMSDEGKWQEHINRLREQGIMINVENLRVTRQNFEAEMDRKEAIEAQVNLLGVLNEAQMRAGQRSSRRTQRDTYFAEMVNQSQDGGTYDQKLAAVNANPDRAAAINTAADVQWLSDRADALADFATQASDITRAASKNATENAFDDTYTEALRRISGITAGSRKALEDTASAADKALAHGFAKLREELEHQPGFARWADQLQPLAERMEEIKGQFMEGLSDGITDTIMGDDVDWNAMWKNIRRAQVKAGVDSALAGVSNFLSGRKPGDLVLSPEAQAAKDSMAEQLAVTERQITATAENTSAAIQAASESAQLAAQARVAADAAREMIPLMQRATAALEASANALAHSAGTEGLDLTALTRTPDAADALLGAGSPVAAATAAGTPSPTTLDLAALARTPAATDSIRGGRAPAATVQSVLPAPRATDRGVQPSDIGAVANQALSALGLNVDVAPLVSAIMGGDESNTSMRTAGAASTAVTAGPTASFAVGEDSGLTSAAQSVFDAGAALTTVPQTFGTATAGFSEVVTKFGEAVQAFAQGVASMGSGGGGGMSDIGSMMGGGGDGFGGSTIPSDLIGLFADGGYVSGKGGPTSDSINARLSNGEFVINAQATAGNRGLLEAINEGKAYAAGGFVDGLPGFAGGGWFSDLAGRAGTAAKGVNMSSVFGKGQNGKYDGGGASFGQMFGKGNSMETRLTGGMNILSTISTLAELFGKKDKPEADPKAVQGVIGEHRGVTVDATEIAAHENPIAMAINMVANMATGGQWDKARAYGQMAYGSVKAIGNAFAEGGYVSSSGAAGMDWSSAPHYKEGTANTSGGMPAVVHPNEAVIPLSGGRKVGVDMSGMDSERSISNTVTSNITVIAPNPDAFRKSQGSIQRQQNRDSRRAANRNLTP